MLGLSNWPAQHHSWHRPVKSNGGECRGKDFVAQTELEGEMGEQRDWKTERSRDRETMRQKD